MPDPLGLPAFPTTFTKEDQDRLDQLQEQRKALETAYQTKFSQEAWQGLGAPERGIRRIAPPWATPVARAIPGEHPSIDFGFTPEQFQTTTQEMEKEFQELTRRDKVTRLLPNIQSDIMVAALSGDAIKDTAELLSTFPEMSADFTDEEIGALSQFAQSIVNATPEQLLSGELFPYDPASVDISTEEIEKFFRDQNRDPRFILNSVALSHNLADIRDALREAYPPEELQTSVEEAIRQKFIDYFKARNEELGITEGGEKPTKGIIQESHRKVADQEGSVLTLTNDVGEMIRGKKLKDGTVLVGDNFVGKYNESTGSIDPIDFSTGEAIDTDTKAENQLKSLWHDFYLGLKTALYGTSQAIQDVIPRSLMAKFGDTYEQRAPYMENWSREKWEAGKKHQEGLLGDYQIKREERELKFKEWYKEHPELAPDPYYEQSPLDNKALLKDPLWYAHVIARNAPVTTTALITGAVISRTTGNYVAGSVAAAAIMTPVQINDLYEDLIANGADPQKASEMASVVGTVIGSVEIVPEMIVLKAASPLFMRAFRKNLSGEVIKEMSRLGILRTASKIEIAEVLEEITQQAIQNAAVKTVNENRDLLQDIPQTAIETIVATLPLAALGGAGTYKAMKSNLPSTLQVEIDNKVAELVDAGLEQDHAEAVAISEIVQTETGQAQVEEAADKAMEKPLPTEETARLQTKINSILDEIKVMKSSRDAQESRVNNANLTVSERTSAQEAMTSLDTRIAELEAQKKKVQRQVKKASVAVVSSEPETQREYIQRRFNELRRSAEASGSLVFFEENKEELERNLNVEYRLQESKIQPAISEEGKAQPITTAPETAVEGNVTEEQGKAIAQELGLEFRGIQEGFGDIPASLQFHNPRTGGSILGSSLEDVRTSLVEEQARFAETPFTQEAVEPSGGGIISAAWTSIDPKSDPLIKNRRPRIEDWDVELSSVTKVVEESAISKNLRIPKSLTTRLNITKDVINDLKAQYEAIKDKKSEQAKELETKLKKIAKEAGLPSKSLLGKGWDDLHPEDRLRLAIQAIPNDSLHFSGMRQFFDIEYFMEMLQEVTGAPFYSIIRRIEASSSAAQTEKDRIMFRIARDPHFKDIRTDEEALKRVEQELNARNKAQGIEHPTNITENELLLADAIEDVYNSYKPIVRYLRVMRADSDIESFKKEFPDAVEDGKEVELEIAIQLKESGNLDDLWNYLYDLDWGVLESGFDPRLIADRSLKIRRTRGFKTTRGEGRLLRRESIEFPESKQAYDLLGRLSAYVEQMEIQWRMEPELAVLSDYWGMVEDKISNWKEVKTGLETWIQRVQGIGLQYSFFDRQLQRAWRQSMAATFLEPFMAFRNSFQPILFHPDRSELAKLTFQKLPGDLEEMGKFYYDTFEEQLGGLRKDWLHTGEKGFLVPDAWNRMADSLNLYGKSDYYPRYLSFKASLNKAYRATEQYLKDGNVQKWIKDSGAIHLRNTEKNYVLTHYLGQPDKVFNLDAPGLHEVKGIDMAKFYVAQRIADSTHFKYRRSSRGIIEMGAHGTTLWNLAVFPRGYAQRLYFQAEKVKDVFKGEATWEEARSGFDDVMKLIVVSLLFDGMFQTITGRKYNPYFILNILFGWQPGGLFLGAAIDLFTLVGDIGTVINPITDKDQKEFAIGRIPQSIERMGDVYVPFYRRAWDIAEAALGSEHLDRYWLRRGRALIDKEYTPEELDKLDANVWERIRKGILGGKFTDLTRLQSAMEKVDESEAKLGTQDVTGRYHTLANFGRDVDSYLRDVPEYLVTDQEGFSPLALFYKESMGQLNEFYKLPARKKTQYRKEHILEEAMLLFWGKYQDSVYVKGSPEANEVERIVRVWFDRYDITKNQHRKWADYTLPKNPAE